MSPLLVHRIEGSGNRFLLVDGVRGDLPADPGAFAQQACAQECGFPEGRRADGVLLLTQEPEAGTYRMVLHNADGGRPETCGNGLRCVAHFVRHHLQPAGDLLLRSDSAEHQVPDTSPVGEISVSMPAPRVEQETLRVEACGRTVEGVCVDVGNPHFVVAWEDLSDAVLDELGPALSVHPQFPAGSNIEFAALHAGDASVRVFERGVGETEACGSGACAVAGVGWTHAGSPPAGEIRIHMPGGQLRVRRHPPGHVWLSGQVVNYGPVAEPLG